MKRFVVSLACFFIFCAAAVRAEIKTAHPRILLDDAALASLQARAAAGTAEWAVLKKWCDTNLPAAIDSGYVGWAWFGAMKNFAIAYHAYKNINPAAANTYAAKALELMTCLARDLNSPGDGKGGLPAVTRDSGYPIRTHGIGLALGYDWLYEYPGFTPALKTEFSQMLDTWLVWYSTGGYQRNGPGLGNYFMSYYSALTFSGYAAYGDNVNAPGYLSAAASFFNTTIKPLYPVIKGGYDPEGWAYSPGYIINLTQSMLAARTAEGGDQFAEFPWAREVVYAALHATKPGMKTMYDGGDWGGSYSGRPTREYIELLSMVFAGTKEGLYCQHYLNTVQAADAKNFLYFDSSRPAEDYEKTEPLAYLAEGSGLVCARSAWGPSAAWVSFQSGSAFVIDHQNRDQGHFTINRNGSDILIDAGMYRGGGIENYASSTKWHNCLLVDDKGEGYMTYPPEQGYWGDRKTTAYEYGKGYLMAEADIAGAYAIPPWSGTKNPLSAYARKFFYVPAANIVVVFDNAAAVKDYFARTLVFHFLNEPVLNGADFIAEQGANRLFAKTVLPETAVVTKSIVPATNNPNLHTWKITVSESVARLQNIFINAFYICDTNTKSGPAMTAVQSVAGFSGVLIGSPVDCLVLFSHDSSMKSNSLQVTLNSSVSRNVVVYGIKPNTRYLLETELDADEHGILSINENADGQVLSSSHGIIFHGPLAQPYGQDLAIEGYVLDSQNNGVDGVQLQLQLPGSSQQHYSTDTGYYKTGVLEPDKTYSITPLKKGYTFSPASRNVSVNSLPVKNCNFTVLSIEAQNSESGIINSLNNSIRIVGSAEGRGTVNPDHGDTAKIFFNGSGAGTVVCRIFTLTGEKVWEQTFENVKSGMFEWIPADSAAGTYVAHVKGPGINKRGKIILIR